MRKTLVVLVWVACTSVLAGRGRAQDVVLQPAEQARERASEAAAPTPAAPTPAAPAPGAPEAAGQSATSVPAAPGTASSDTAATAPPTQAATPSPSAPAQPDTSAAQTYSARAVVPPEPGTLHEEERIGDYGQPRWSAIRRFPNTRVYVRPAGSFGLEWWAQTKQSLHDAHEVRNRNDYEMEVGLGHRLQLDMYLESEQLGHWSSPIQLAREKVELRYALADWGVIPLNPTLYAEFVRQNGAPPTVEFKGLFGEQIAPRWHFGANIVLEHLLGANQQNEWSLTTGLSYTLSDSSFSLGGEIVFETVDESGHRLTFDNWELLAGPSIAWSPVPPMHVLFVGLLGNETELDRAAATTKHTPLFEPTLIVGWEL
ncbi:MAG: hypothetical protein ACHQ53_18055 [Polyangiales bacterium]